MKFRKRPVEVDAVQWSGGNYKRLERFCGFNWGRADAKNVAWTVEDDGEQVVLWNTAESQWLLCPVGWWVIRGIQGELYPCKPDIFEATYEKVEP